MSWLLPGAVGGAVSMTQRTGSGRYDPTRQPFGIIFLNGCRGCATPRQRAGNLAATGIGCLLARYQGTADALSAAWTR